MIRRNIIVAIVMAAILVAGVYAAVFLTQTLPTANIPQTVVTSTCTSLITASTLTAQSGAIQFNCAGSPALTTIVGSSIPTLNGFSSCTTQPQPITSPCYSNFGYLDHADTVDCVAGATIGAWFHPIASGTPVTFIAGSWDYCGFYAAPSEGGTLPSFTIAWS